MVLTRAFACAVPVVASDIPGYRAVMTDDTGVLVPPGDRAALADALVAPARGRAAAARRSASARAGSRSSATRGTRSPSGSSRSTARSRHEVAARIPRSPWTRGGDRARVPRRRRRAALVARAALGRLHGRLHRRRVEVGRRRGRAQPALGRRARGRVGHGDPLGDAAAASRASRLVFSAFSVGLLANAVLPGRVGELARVAVLTRRMNRRGARGSGRRSSARSSRTASSTSSRSRCSSSTSSRPRRSRTGRSRASPIVLSIGVGLFLFAFASARHHGHTRLEGMGTVRRVVTMARLGLGVMRQLRRRR